MSVLVLNYGIQYSLSAFFHLKASLGNFCIQHDNVSKNYQLVISLLKYFTVILGWNQNESFSKQLLKIFMLFMLEWLSRIFLILYALLIIFLFSMIEKRKNFKVKIMHGSKNSWQASGFFYSNFSYLCFFKAFSDFNGKDQWIKIDIYKMVFQNPLGKDWESGMLIWFGAGIQSLHPGFDSCPGKP